jgi:hypothetical protein
MWRKHYTVDWPRADLTDPAVALINTPPTSRSDLHSCLKGPTTTLGVQLGTGLRAKLYGCSAEGALADKVVTATAALTGDKVPTLQWAYASCRLFSLASKSNRPAIQLRLPCSTDRQFGSPTNCSLGSFTLSGSPSICLPAACPTPCLLSAAPGHRGSAIDAVRIRLAFRARRHIILVVRTGSLLVCPIKFSGPGGVVRKLALLSSALDPRAATCVRHR